MANSDLDALKIANEDLQEMIRRLTGWQNVPETLKDFEERLRLSMSVADRLEDDISQARFSLMRSAFESGFKVNNGSNS
jgi:hypothetical protein